MAFTPSMLSAAAITDAVNRSNGLSPVPMHPDFVAAFKQAAEDFVSIAFPINNNTADHYPTERLFPITIFWTSAGFGNGEWNLRPSWPWFSFRLGGTRQVAGGPVTIVAEFQQWGGDAGAASFPIPKFVIDKLKAQGWEVVTTTSVRLVVP